MANAHDEIISLIIDAISPEAGEIRLVGRVKDPCINNASENEIFFFIPDLHLISPMRKQRFGKYGFNYEDQGLLLRILEKVVVYKGRFESDRTKKLVTVQVGDFFDMWREFPGVANPGAVADITHDGLRDILYRGSMRGRPCLKATMILGNHDTRNGIPLPEIPFQMKAFNRTDNDSPFLFVTHGDTFDVLEKIVPEEIKEFAVDFVGSLTPVNKYWISKWGKSASAINKSFGDLEDSITEPLHSLADISEAPVVLPESPLPDLLCNKITSPDKADNEFFKKMYTALDITEVENLPGQHVRVVAIGHTHQAVMILFNPQYGRRPLLLMDMGAWIEKCKYPLDGTGEVVCEPSAQIGVIHGNDARLYQISIPEYRENG